MKTIDRRRMLAGVGGLATACLLTNITGAVGQTYPDRAIKLISPYAAGGATDTMARILGQWISDRLGASVVVENKPGGGANIGTESVIRAPADGYTLLLASTANAVNATLFPKLNFNFLQDVVAVGSIGNAFNVLLVHPSMTAKTTAELIAHMRANPGKVTVGLPGNGSPQHMSAELFRSMTGTEPVLVQYRGGSTVLNDLVGGHIQAGFASSISSAGFIEAGTLRALGVTTARRSEAFPDLPSIAEAVAGYEAVNFYGIVAPKGTPDAIVQKLHEAINAGLGDANIKRRLAVLGVVPTPMTPAAFMALMVAETEKWGKVVKASNLKPT
jgi:tripartite-type tricarboxylate transporter receptor subunit TctC